MKSPFKLLEPYTFTDNDIFFGREGEILLLRELLYKASLVVVYGKSGTGKTSLIQSGLTSKLPAHDCLPLWIRYNTNISDSLQLAIQKVLPKAEGSIPTKIHQLFQHYLRPVYLIFDQFEEFLVLGTATEHEQFISTLKNLLSNKLPCKVLIIIREDYISQLYPFERAIPQLFEFRMRVEPMSYQNVKAVIRESFQAFNITFRSTNEEDVEMRLDEIIQNVSLEHSGIELAYLQVYLDQLYRENLQNNYLKQTSLSDQYWPAIEFKKETINRLGNIDWVLNRYLDEQLLRIQIELAENIPNSPDDAAMIILAELVSFEGTKRRLPYKRDDKNIKIENTFFKITDETVTFCLEELEKTKLVHIEPGVIEIAHDNIALIIFKRQSKKQVQDQNMKRQIKLAMVTFDITNEYLTPKQLASFEEVLFQLAPDEAAFFQDSKHFRNQQEKAVLAREKYQSVLLFKNKQLLVFAAIVILCVVIWALQK